MVILPTRFDGEARYSLNTDLDGVSFIFLFEWNDRDAGWYFSIQTGDGTPLLSGRRVVLNYSLTNIYRDPRLPAGVFIAIDTSGADQEPGLKDLGDRVLLMYATAEEAAALV